MSVQALLRKAATALDAERAKIDRQREAIRAVLNGVGGGRAAAWGSRGGLARAAALSPRKRRAIALKGVAARWNSSRTPAQKRAMSKRMKRLWAKRRRGK